MGFGLRASLSIGFAIVGLACKTTYVLLGNDEAASDGTAGGAAVGGAGGSGGIGGVSGAAGAGGGCAGFTGTGGGCVVGGSGGFAGFGGFAGASGSCAPSEETQRICAPYANSERRYDYHGCLNQVGIGMGHGVGGAPGALCEGYLPCSYQHEGCLHYRTDGAAGSNNGGCAGAPGDPAWLEDCGGNGYYGEDIVGPPQSGGAGGVGGGVAGSGGS